MPEVTPKNIEISLFQKIRDRFGQGLVIKIIRDKVQRLGLEITLFYWVQEGSVPLEIPSIRGNAADYTLMFFGPEELKTIGATVTGFSEKELLELLASGKKCFGLKYNREIAAFMWMNLDECHYQPAGYKLKENEAYLHNMYTLNAFRGKNLAPYLRYHSYQILKTLGKDTFFSASEIWNSPANKYKNKLRAKHLKLVFTMELFKKLRWSFKVKDCLSLNTFNLFFICTGTNAFLCNAG